jgi:hypothetical protein
LTLHTRREEKIEYLQFIKNGRSVAEVRLDEHVKQRGGSLPGVEFERSGWMLVRAVTNNTQTYQYAATGPYFVEVDGQPRISRAAAQYFLDWVYQRARQLSEGSDEHRQQLLPRLRVARDFWRDRVERATDD